MNEPAPDDWAAEQIRDRLAKLHAARPAAYNTPGTLNPELAAWADKAANGHPGNLVIVGNVGVGKSWSLWAIAERLVTRGWRQRIDVAPAHKLRRHIAPPVDQPALDRLAHTGLLALDDIGSIRISDWDSDHLMAVIDTRWENQKPTIVTSNQLDLRLLLGDRVASRLAHNATIATMTGPDRRRNP